MYKYELHMHTKEGSACGRSSGAEMVDYYISRGYSGMVVSDHFYHGNTAASRDLPWQEFVHQYALGYEGCKRAALDRDFDVFFGVEERLDGWDEYIVLGLEPEWYANHPELREANGAAFLDIVRQNGAFVIHAHPFRERDYMKNLSIRLCPDRVDAIEVRNIGNPPEIDRRSYEYAKKHGFPMTGGSDNHVVSDIGKPLSGIEVPFRCRELPQLIEAIRQNRHHVIDIEAVLDAPLTRTDTPVVFF